MKKLLIRKKDSENINFVTSWIRSILSSGRWLAGKFGWVVEVVLRPDECPSKFQVLPKRWIVERTFSWLENFRRLTIDYEFLAETAEAMVQLACVQIMLNKFFV